MNNEIDKVVEEFEKQPHGQALSSWGDYISFPNAKNFLRQALTQVAEKAREDERERIRKSVLRLHEDTGQRLPTPERKLEYSYALGDVLQVLKQKQAND